MLRIAVAFGLLVGLAGAPTLAQTREEAGAELYDQIVAAITEAGVSVSDEVDGEIRELANVAAKRLAADRAMEARFDEAEANAARLGTAIAAVARARQRDRAESRDLAAALASLCPLYPFC